ncbi:MAG: HAD-IA family hydrolase [Candidatus Babeliales bacterium]
MNTQQPIPSNIIFDIFGVLFHWDPLQPRINGESQFIPIEENIALLAECASLINELGKPIHRLFVLSNCKLNLLEELYVAYPHVFEPFEGIVIPTHAGYAKPDKRMFEHLLALHMLHPSNSIFIDDAPENTKAAVQLGITAITYGPGIQLKRAFITHGVIPYTHA